MLNPDLVLPQLLGLRAAEAGDNIAAEDVGGESFTYEGLHESCLTWADAYRRIGVVPGDKVVTMLPNRVESYCAWLGLAWLRAIEVPINTGYRGRMLRYVLENSTAKVLVIAAAYLDQLAEVAEGLPGTLTVVVPDGATPGNLPFPTLDREQFLGGAQPARDLEGPDESDVACMIYTSGTTGPSKGVLVPWGELFQWPAGVRPGTIGKGEGYYAYMPQFHVGGKSVLYIVVLNAARAVLRETFSVTEFWDDLRRHDCVVTGLFGPLLGMLLQAPAAPDDRDTPLRSVTVAPVPANYVDFEKRFGTRVDTAFGTTEIGLPLVSDDVSIAVPGSCGRLRQDADPGYEVRIADDRDRPLGPGTIGELLIRTTVPWRLNLGYFGMPEKTAEAWRNGWFHTGDAFTYDEAGNFFFVDRLKDAIRRRGENISSVELEAYVLDHPDVLECAAIGVPAEYGEDEIKIVVVRRPEASVTEEELIRSLLDTMPRFMVPRYVEFVGSLPKTEASFRVQKVALREQALNENTWDREAAGVAVPR